MLALLPHAALGTKPCTVPIELLAAPWVQYRPESTGKKKNFPVPQQVTDTDLIQKNFNLDAAQQHSTLSDLLEGTPKSQKTIPAIPCYPIS